jgi:hypothetical protein
MTVPTSARPHPHAGAPRLLPRAVTVGLGRLRAAVRWCFATLPPHPDVIEADWEAAYWPDAFSRD